MTKKELNEILTNPGSISDEQLNSLEQLAVNFPYCQIAHILIAKAYFDKDNMLSHQKIRTASAYTTDRQHLKNVIEKGLFDKKTETQDSEVIEVKEQTQPSIADSVEEEIQPITPDEDQVVDFDNIPDPVDKQEAVEPKESKAEQETPPITVQSREAEAERKEGDLAEAEPVIVQHSSVPEPDSDLMRTLQELKESREKAQEEAAEIDTNEPAAEKSKSEAVEEPVPESVKPTKKENKERKKETEPEKETKEEPEKESSIQAKNSVVKRKPTRAAHKPTKSAPKERKPSIQRRATRASKKAQGEKEIANKITEIPKDEQLGYKMHTSRLGEALQERDDLTPEEAREFYPDLMLEYLNSLKARKRKAATNKKKSEELISSFIKNEPSIAPVKDNKEPAPSNDLSENSTELNPQLVTENLAKINVKQGNIKRAISIYEQLILKNPEKKSFFASEIEKLKNT